MNKSHFHFPSRIFYPRRLVAGQGQGLVEYVILIAIIGTLTIFGLILIGGSLQGGFMKVCASLGNDGCQAVQTETAIAGAVTPTLQVSMTPSLIPTATPTLSEPDPTRQPVLTVIATQPAPTQQLKTLKIKVVLNEEGGGEKSPQGIRVVVYNPAREYVTEGVTNNKGKVSFSVVSGNYIVATFYNNVWQNDGPFSTTNSRENVIHR